MTTITDIPLVPVSQAKLRAHKLAAIKAFKAEELERQTRPRTKYISRDELYCRHGVYIGDPYGPDFLCGYCESGVSDYEYVIGSVKAEASGAQRRYREALSALGLYTDALHRAYEREDTIAAIPLIVERIAEESMRAASFHKEWF